MRTPNTFWHSHCVLITGASSGIGQALAEHLVAQGAKVGLIARRQPALEGILAALSAPPGQAAYACADVTDPDGLAKAVRQLEHQLGACTVMVANAGIYHKTDVLRFDAAVQNAVLATNVLGVINTIAAVLPGMVERKRGHLVAVSSIAAMVGLPAAGSYSASKAALVALFQSLRVDLHPLGIKATVVAPGFVDTPIITDEERASVKDLLSAAQAASRICTAIERDRAIDWFPWQTWLVCRLFSLLPSGMYRRLVAHLPDMEEAQPRQ